MKQATKKSKKGKSLKSLQIDIPTGKAKATGINPVTEEERKKLQERANEKIIFSFKFIDLKNELFNLGTMEKRKVPICSEWFITLIETLKEISTLTPDELRTKQRNHYDYHPHDWDKVSAKFNFSDEFLEQVEGVQFRLSSSIGRVHGFMIGNRFYIVWLDPHHNMNPDDRFGGIKHYQKPQTCFEKLNEEVLKLKKENKELMEILDEATKSENILKGDNC